MTSHSNYALPSELFEEELASSGPVASAGSAYMTDLQELFDADSSQTGNGSGLVTTSSGFQSIDSNAFSNADRTSDSAPATSGALPPPTAPSAYADPSSLEELLETQKELIESENNTSGTNPYATPDDIESDLASITNNTAAVSATGPVTNATTTPTNPYATGDDLAELTEAKSEPESAQAGPSSNYATPDDLIENPNASLERSLPSATSNTSEVTPSPATAYAGPDDVVGGGNLENGAFQKLYGRGSAPLGAKQVDKLLDKKMPGLVKEVSEDAAKADISGLIASLPPIRDWQAEYMSIMQQSPQSFTDAARKYRELFNLIREFSAVARSVGKVIASEAHLPVTAKTVKPADVGGIAGGQKFYFHNIFFKRVMDDMGLYGGLDGANKVGDILSQSLVHLKISFIPQDNRRYSNNSPPPWLC